MNIADRDSMTPMRSLHHKEVLTTGEVARICHVAARTVSKWFDTGKLRGYRIPGSRDRRIPTEHLLAFMRAHGIPLEELDGGLCRVLIVGDAPAGLEAAVKAYNRYEIRRAANGFEAGLVAQQLHPHVIVLDVHEPRQDAIEFARSIRCSSTLGAAKVIAAIDIDDSEPLPQGSFDGLLPKSYSPVQLVNVIEQVTNIIT